MKDNVQENKSISSQRYPTVNFCHDSDNGVGGFDCGDASDGSADLWVFILNRGTHLYILLFLHWVLYTQKNNSAYKSVFYVGVSVCASHVICRGSSLCVHIIIIHTVILFRWVVGGGLRWQMAEVAHLVVVKFKEEVVVEDIIQELEKLVSQLDSVKSFVWGKDIESLEMLTQGFTHAFMMTFGSKDDFTAFQAHPNHVEFSATFSAAIDKIVLLDFPVVAVKPATA